MSSVNKTQPSQNSVADYLETINDTKRQNDAKCLTEIMQAETGARPVLWGTSIVGYGNYHYKYDSGREGDTAAVGFSARKAALTIYGLFHYEENQQNIQLASQLGPHTHGKGCLYIKKLEDVNIDILKRMIAGAYSARNNT